MCLLPVKIIVTTGNPTTIVIISNLVLGWQLFSYLYLPLHKSFLYLSLGFSSLFTSTLTFIYFLSLILKFIRSLLSDITSNFLLYSHLSSLDCMLQVNFPSFGFEAITAVTMRILSSDFCHHVTRQKFALVSREHTASIFSVENALQKVRLRRKQLAH